jgi:hypothetical protein
MKNCNRMKKGSRYSSLWLELKHLSNLHRDVQIFLVDCIFENYLGRDDHVCDDDERCCYYAYHFHLGSYLDRRVDVSPRLRLEVRVSQ